jgi:hypothetical protein
MLIRIQLLRYKPYGAQSGFTKIPTLSDQSKIVVMKSLLKQIFHINHQ